MTRLVVELDDDAARRLAERAEREGIEPSALAQRLLSEASEVDPFEFFGSFASDAVNGRDADEFLDREGFRRALIVDTGPFVAATNRDDRDHDACPANLLRNEGTAPRSGDGGGRGDVHHRTRWWIDSRGCLPPLAAVSPLRHRGSNQR